MKKIFTVVLTASMMLFGPMAVAQPSVSSGLAMTNTKSGNEVKLTGFYAGFNYNIEVAFGLGFAPGVYFSMLTKSNFNDYFAGIYVPASSNITEQYLSAPVMLNYGLHFGEKFVLRLYCGPTFSYGISSQAKGGSEVDFYDESHDYERLNIAVGGGMAFEFSNRIRFDAGYDQGMKKRADVYSAGASKVTTDSFHAGVSFIF